MKVLQADGQPAKAEEKPEEPGIPDKPLIAIDPLGNMTLFIPLNKTNEVFARGMVDMARSQLLTWYAQRVQEQRKIEQMNQKSAFRQFADKMMGRK